MPDLRPLPVLARREPVAAPQVRLSALPEGTILLVVGGPNMPEPADPIESLAAGAGLSARAVPPGQWLLVGDRPTAHVEMRRLLAALEPHASGFDQSHGRVRLRLEGPMAATVLSKGTAVDLHPSAFPEGRTAATLIGHVSAWLTRLDTQAFEIVVPRTFAEAAWDSLAGMCGPAA